MRVQVEDPFDMYPLCPISIFFYSNPPNNRFVYKHSGLTDALQRVKHSRRRHTAGIDTKIAAEHISNPMSILC